MIPRDSIDFYPTPDDLANELVGSAMQRDKYGHRYFPGPVLEPSAGNGSLAFAIERACDIRRGKDGAFVGSYGNPMKNPHNDADNRRLDLDAIELSADFRAVLKSKGLRVVHDDFLTFRPAKKYAAIIMNPPFSKGAAHLLKALDIQRDGGAVRCILNAETIRNPCTNERKILVDKLKSLGASIEYKTKAFSNGLRKTNVEIAIISVDIPEKPPVSRIRLDLQREMTDELTADNELAALVASDPIAAAIQRYNAAVEGLRRLYSEFHGIESLLTPVSRAARVNDKRVNDKRVVSLNKPYNSAIRDLRALYWRTLFDLPQIRDRLTSTMRSEYETRLSELADYDFSAYNILTIRQEISQNTVHGIEQEIIKLFNNWTNLHYNPEYSKNIHYFNGWCTNEAYKIGKRVIFNCDAFPYSSWRWGTNDFRPAGFRAEESLHNIEMTLHYLDTNGATYDSSALHNALLAAEKSGQTKNIQLHYFKATFYKKGTCHIEFTNEDVLKSFNLFACQRKGWLPPSYGKKHYNDMSAGEKKVVDNYEGEASYTDSLTRGLIPTTATLLRIAAPTTNTPA